MSYFYNRSFSTAQEIPITRQGIECERSRMEHSFWSVWFLSEAAIRNFVQVMKISSESPKSPFGRRNPRKTRPRESLRLQRISELQNSEVWDDGYQAFIGFTNFSFNSNIYHLFKYSWWFSRCCNSLSVILVLISLMFWQVIKNKITIIIKL